MKILTIFTLILVLTSIFFIVGCDETTSEEENEENIKEIGIDDIFKSDDEITPPQIPNP